MSKEVYTSDDEITLKELILKGQEFYQELYRNKMWIALAVLLSTAAFLVRAVLTPKTFAAEITFMVDDDGGDGASGVGALLGQFGFGGGSSGDYNLDKIVELSKSMSIVQQALFEKATVKDQEDYYANHLIRIYDLHEDWKEDEDGLNGFLFTRTNVEDFEYPERKALKSVYGKVIGNAKVEGLLNVSFEETTGILAMMIKSEVQGFSIGFVQALYEKVSQFYIKEAIEKPTVTFENLSKKADSLAQELSSKEYQLAKSIEKNSGLVSITGQMKLERMRREVELLAAAYAKIIENKEVADFSLKNATPFFQVIDKPMSPINPKKASRGKAVAIGIFLGLFLSVFYFLIRKIYRETMNAED